MNRECAKTDPPLHRPRRYLAVLYEHNDRDTYISNNSSPLASIVEKIFCPPFI